MKNLYGFASDYDNTLFMHKWYRPGISRRDRKAIESFQASGGMFGLCTGRPYRGFILDPFINKMHIDFYIASTGAHILSGDGDVLFEQTMDFELIKELYASQKDCLRHSLHMDGQFYSLEKGTFRRPVPTLGSLDEAKGHKIYEMSFRLDSQEKAAEVTARLNDKFGDTFTAFQNVRDIDVVAKGCSKGFGLTFIKDKYNLRQTGGMGDSLNDLSLVESADFGFTFKNAPDALVSAAYSTAKSVSDALKIFHTEISSH